MKGKACVPGWRHTDDRVIPLRRRSCALRKIWVMAWEADRPARLAARLLMSIYVIIKLNYSRTAY